MNSLLNVLATMLTVIGSTARVFMFLLLQIYKRVEILREDTKKLQEDLEKEVKIDANKLNVNIN